MDLYATLMTLALALASRLRKRERRARDPEYAQLFHARVRADGEREAQVAFLHAGHFEHRGHDVGHSVEVHVGAHDEAAHAWRCCC